MRTEEEPRVLSTSILKKGGSYALVATLGFGIPRMSML